MYVRLDLFEKVNNVKPNFEDDTRLFVAHEAKRKILMITYY